MPELLSYLLLPLAKLISDNTPSKLRTALANTGRTLTALEVAFALYAISLSTCQQASFLIKWSCPSRGSP